MKTQKELLGDIERRIQKTWHTDVTKETQSWPHNFAIKRTSTTAKDDFAKIQASSLTWADWAKTKQVDLVYRQHRVHGTIQNLPTHIVIPSMDVAANLLSTAWVQKVSKGIARARTLAELFPSLQCASKIIRGCSSISDADFELLCNAGRWFAQNDASGLTPRQVPIEGLHAKWLNTNIHMVKALSGKNDFNLLPAHPQRVHFVYLDPGYRKSGQRVHDSATVGDTFTPAYTPDTVIISENKDTAMHFPATENGVSVEGSGFAVTAAGRMDWVRRARNCFYWGDIDAEGYEILNSLRESGLKVKSLLMDLETLNTYSNFRATTDKNGKQLEVRPRKELGYLNESETQVYNLLTDKANTKIIRIEQERITLETARKALQEALEEASE